MDEQHSEHVDNLIDAYALGALEPDEADRVEAHLTGCASCRVLLAASHATANALLSAAPLIHPPAGLRAKVLSQVRTVAEEERRGLAPAVSARRARPAPRGPISRVIAGLLGREPSEQDATLERLAQLLAEPESLIWEVAGTQEAPGARARLVGVPSGREAVLVTSGLRPLAANQAYQVWLLRGGQPQPNAVFTVSSSGEGQQVVQAPRRLSDFELVAVTPEPAGGSPVPTGPIVLAGALA
jgi:anti-sigma-K factor RskA